MPRSKPNNPKKTTRKPVKEEKNMKKTTNKTAKKTKEKKPRKTYKEAYTETREKVWDRKRARLKLHHSFRRSYREDYKRPLKAPGLVSHANTTMKIIFKNWRLFLPLLVMVVICNVLFVGIMNQQTYESVQDSLDESYAALKEGNVLSHLAKSGLLVATTVTTGGLNNGMSEVQQVCLIFFFAITWLITIYFLRHLLAGNKPKFRDGIFNALTPLLSSLCVIAVVFVHALPIIICTVVYSSAISTGFLNTPLYAFVFWLFCSLLLLLSFYLLPSSLTALVSVSVPGMYPMTALHAATDLLQGRRTKYIIRLLFLLLYLAVLWVIILVPLFWLDLVLKENIDWLEGFPFAPLCLQVMTTFSAIYVTAYLYLYYRRMLDDTN